MHERGTAKQRTRSTRLHTAVETSLDPTYMDRTEISLRADILLPWADIPQSVLGSAKVNTLQNEVQNGVHRIRYPPEALVIMHGDA
jgi:hypothetical protein